MLETCLGLWFLIVALCTAYVAWDAFTYNPEITVMKWAFVLVFVIGATAVSAVIQLRHLRASNQLEGLLTVLARVEDPSFNAWVDGARRVLEENMPHPNYRGKIANLTYDRENNPWLNLANSYEWVGSLVKNGLIPEESFMDVYAFRILRAWE